MKRGDLWWPQFAYGIPFVQAQILFNFRDASENWILILCSQRAESELAYELQAAKLRQKIRAEEILISVVERRKQVEVEAEEVRVPAPTSNYIVVLTFEPTSATYRSRVSHASWSVCDWKAG